MTFCLFRWEIFYLPVIWLSRNTSYLQDTVLCLYFDILRKLPNFKALSFRLYLTFLENSLPSRHCFCAYTLTFLENFLPSRHSFFVCTLSFLESFLPSRHCLSKKAFEQGKISLSIFIDVGGEKCFRNDPGLMWAYCKCWREFMHLHSVSSVAPLLLRASGTECERRTSVGSPERMNELSSKRFAIKLLFSRGF